MENVIRKLYGMYMDNDNGEENEMSVMHSDVTSIPHIFITHSYYRIKLILTTVSQDNLSISKRRKVILICIINLCYINVNPV